MSFVYAEHSSDPRTLNLSSNHYIYGQESGDIVLTISLTDWHGEDFVIVDVYPYSYEYTPVNSISGNGGWYPTIHYGQVFDLSQVNGETVTWTLNKNSFAPYPNPVMWKAVASFYPSESYEYPTHKTTIQFKTIYGHE